MSEVGEAPQFQPEQEKELTKEEGIKSAVGALAELFEERFENSTIKKSGRPKIIGYEEQRGAYFDGGKIIKDPRILVCEPPREFSEFKDALWWTVDQSEKNQIKIIRGNPNDIYERVIIKTNDTPSIEYDEYELVEVPYDLRTSDIFEEKLRVQSKNTQKAIDKAIEILSNIPQVKKGQKSL